MNLSPRIVEILLWVIFPHILLAEVNVTFDPPEVVRLQVNKRADVNFTIMGVLEDLSPSCSIVTLDPSIAEVVSNSSCFLTSKEEDHGRSGSFTVEGKFLGRTKVCLENGDSCLSTSLPISVVKQITVFKQVQFIILTVTVILGYTAMGCAMDLNLVKGSLKRPTGVMLGFVSQYAVMPALTYGFGRAFLDDPANRLGLFTYGCCPGGGGSNMWTVLFDGNINLSVTMTFVSTIASLGMMPLWLYTLGRTIYSGSEIIIIPFENIVLTLAVLVVPVFIGLVIKWKLPKVAKTCHRYILRPLTLLLALYFLVFGIALNYEMFLLMTWRVAAAALCTGWGSCLIGGLGAFLFRFGKEDIIAMAVETGIQNAALSMVMINRSLKPPDSHLASILSMSTNLFTLLSLLVIYVVVKVRNCIFRHETLRVEGRELEKEMAVVTNIKDNSDFFLAP